MQMKRTTALLIFALCAGSCVALRQTRSISHVDVASNFSSSKLPVMLNIPQYKKDCWQKRPVSMSFLQGRKNPGAGLEPFTPYEEVLKDGFMPIDCVKDKLFLSGDKFGDGKFSYKLENVSNVSIVHYTEIVPKEDRKPMTQKVCFEFCRTVPEMSFFGIIMGRDCYCAPYYKMVADDSSMCDQLCEGDSTLVCGGKSKSSIFSMHMCASTQADLKKASIATNMMVGDLKTRMTLANALSGKMQEAAELNQKIFGKAGDPASSDLMQIAKEFAGELEESARKANRIADELHGLKEEANTLDGKGAFDESDTVTKAERLMEKMDADEPEAVEKRKAMSKLIKLASPGQLELGSGLQYYPMMYFVDKKYAETMTTCKGPLVDKPIVGESIDGCASACDAEIHNCVGFMYYGTGPSSLCFLYSGFKTAMYWTGCDKAPAKKEFVQIQQSASVEIEPWGCGAVSSAWQSQTTGKGDVTSIQRLNVSTGKYELVFEIPKSRTKPEFYSINSCAINPEDDILYCTMQMDVGSFLVAIDKNEVAFVAKMPQWQYAGIFDKKGNYYCNGEKSWSVLSGVTGMAKKSSLYSLRGEKFEEHFVEAKSLGADMAEFDQDLEGKGSNQAWIISMVNEDITLIRVDPKPYTTHKLKAKGIPAGKSWASVWSFKSSIFFGAEDGSGVYQLDLPSMAIESKTATFIKAGESAKLEWNDGFGCPKASGGIIPTLPPNPKPNPFTASTTTEKPEPGPTTTTTEKVPPPKIGQVLCMAKLSKFEGTTLKPNPSGKCKQCLRKLVKAQRCYE